MTLLILINLLVIDKFWGEAILSLPKDGPGPLLEGEVKLELLGDSVLFPELLLDLGASLASDKAEEKTLHDVSEENLLGLAAAVPPLAERVEPVLHEDRELVSRTKRPEALPLFWGGEPLDLDISRVKTDLLAAARARPLEEVVDSHGIPPSVTTFRGRTESDPRTF